MDKYLNVSSDVLMQYGMSLVSAILIYIIGKWVAKMIKRMVVKVMEKSSVDPILVKFTANLAYGALLVFIILAALNSLGVQTTSFIAVIGAAGLAIGLAFQNSLSNFSAGVLMVIFRPFKVGDFVEAGGVAGIVEEIDIFTTHIRSGDNKAIIVPNSGVMGGNIVNYSAKDTRRIDLVIGIAYDADIRKAKDIMTEILNSDERILSDPAPTIGVLELADSSVNLALRPWVKTSDYWDVYFMLLETIKVRFDAEGIGIPFPQRDVHLYNMSN